MQRHESLRVIVHCNTAYSSLHRLLVKRILSRCTIFVTRLIYVKNREILLFPVYCLVYKAVIPQ